MSRFGIVVAMVLWGLVASSAAAPPMRQCKRACQDIVHQCVDSGGPHDDANTHDGWGRHRTRVRCQRAYWHACRRVGLEACPTVSTTTTLVTSGSTTTTNTLPTSSGAIHLSVSQAGPFDHDHMYSAFQIAITGDGNNPIAVDPRYLYVIDTGGLHYNALPAPYMMMGWFVGDYCSAADIVPHDGTVVCWIAFVMPPWVDVGELWFDGGGYQDHVPFRF